MRRRKNEMECEFLKEKARSWPDVSDGWPAQPASVTSLAVFSKELKSLEPLRGFTRLRELSLCPSRAMDAGVLASLPELRVLFLFDPPMDWFKQVCNLEKLEVLGITHGGKLESLEGIEKLRNLRSFSVYHLPKVRSISPLAKLKNLRELSIRMSFGTNKWIRFETLRPLGELPLLEMLELAGVAPDDASLRPLGELKKLKYLNMGAALPLEEYAYLAAKLPKLDSPLLQPGRLQRTSIKCRKCGSCRAILVGKTSKKSKLIVCPKCNQSLIDEHVRLFEQYRESFSK